MAQILAQPITHTLIVHDERGEVVIRVQQPAVTILQVGQVGPSGLKGDKGDQGDQGEPGLDGVGDSRYEHIQIAASNSWVINHNLNKFPSVTVVDSGDNVVYGNYQYVDSNTVILNFSVPFGGKAYLN